MPDPASTTPQGAVFLSYAREDAAIAQGIAGALRGFSIEVWLDRSELRGGDAWDQKIRRQIKDCSLFLPIVSESTQARGEGYFRLEWKLAVERMHLMAEGVPFLMPVAIGTVSDANAIVPPEFLRVQWSPLPNGHPTRDFVAQVDRMLRLPRTAAAPGASSAAAGPRFAAPRGASRAKSGLAWGALTAVVLGAAAFLWMRRQGATATDALAAAAAERMPNDKSIAVLPFTNMSADKDNAFFADGMHEDVLADLALIHELRVVSRTSVEQYRETTKPIGQIGRELGVAYVLEGSVQRAGNRVRVTGQLIKAATDGHVWAHVYDADLTDVFAIQSQLSESIAAALATAISPQEQDLLSRRPTQNIAAYDLLLKARDVDRRQSNIRGNRSRVQLLESAVELDPNFAQAWAELADAYALAHFRYIEGSEDYPARAQKAIERANQLAPDDPVVIADRGAYYFYGFRDYARAAAEYERLAELRPNDPTLFDSLGLIQRRQGQWAEALINERRAVQLDASNHTFLGDLASTLLALRRYDEALDVWGKWARADGIPLHHKFIVASWHLLLRGDPGPEDAFGAHLSPEVADSSEGIFIRKMWAWNKGDTAEWARLDRQQPFFDGRGDPHYDQAVQAALNYCVRGDRAAARRRLADFPQQLRARVAADPDNVDCWIDLGWADVILGRADEARQAMQKVRAVMPLSRDAVQGAQCIGQLACMAAWLGDKETALAELVQFENVPFVYATGPITPYSLPTDTLLQPLKDDPRMKALAERRMQPLL